MEMEGSRLKRWGVGNDGAYDVNQNYSSVGFDLVDSDGQGGELNSRW